MSISRDFSDQELHQIKQAVFSHYKRDVQIRLADSDVLLEGDDKESVNCPAVFWHADDANFMVIKTADNTFRSQFFYTPHDQHDGVGGDHQTDLSQCVAGVLSAQSQQKR